MFDRLIATSFHYGDPSDYDEWARLGGQGAEPWAYKEFHKSAKVSTNQARTFVSDIMFIQVLSKI
jgi:hypothetical protein